MKMLYAEGLASPEIEIAEGAMLDNKSKYADLRIMLDSNRENIKKDAMKRIINMVAKGKDVSELFPAVVKNVAVKDLELKKLVYVYLVRYAEEQQDLALLSISTFQRALKDPNQLIRASALRVLSSIRVGMITPVMLLAIKESVRDMSAYVRKVAAYAIPKLYALDMDLQPQLIECIDFLLADKRTLVLGSAVHAFNEICPDRFDLLHRHFRSLCRALADVDEWGQVVMINLLTRYARTQFVSPLINEEQVLDPDHTLLILSAKPLLQSRNCAVVMAVAQLLYYIAPHNQLSIVPRALVRLLRGPNEVQYVILINIATICAVRNDLVNKKIFAISKNLFEPFLKSFFVRSFDTIHVKQLKLQILTSLVLETNVQLVIQELQAYLKMSDLASMAIEAIGRCALKVPSAADTCLTCLINLISSNKENVVCSAVIVLKRLLHADAPLQLLKRFIKLIDTINAPTARACVIWLMETHCNKVSKLVPDFLRKLAKNFCNEADCVKLQILNLAVCLWRTDREKCDLLVRHILQLARYDRSYDIRDRCRFIRNLLFNENLKRIPDIFLSKKPVPVVQSKYTDRECFQLGTLSHLLNQKCSNYIDIPDFPTVAPDPTIRRNAHPLSSEENSVIANQKSNKNGIYIDNKEEDEEEDEEEEEEDEGDEEDEEDEEEEEDEEVEEVDEDEEDIDEQEESADEEKDSEDRSDEILFEKITDEEDKNNNKAYKFQKSTQNTNANYVKKKPKKNETTDLLDLLGDVDFNSVSLDNGNKKNCLLNLLGDPSGFQRSSAQFVNNSYFQILSPTNTGGLTIQGRFSRSPCLSNKNALVIELLMFYKNPKISEAKITIKNKNESSYTNNIINVTELKENENRTVDLYDDFGDSEKLSTWSLNWSFRENESFNFELKVPFGEQIEPIDITLNEFELHKAQLLGMHQINQRLMKQPTKLKDIYKIANCKQVTDAKWNFAAQTISRKDIVLISISDFNKTTCQVSVNCENIIFASILCKEIQEAFFD